MVYWQELTAFSRQLLTQLNGLVQQVGREVPYQIDFGGRYQVLKRALVRLEECPRWCHCGPAKPQKQPCGCFAGIWRPPWGQTATTFENRSSNGPRAELDQVAGFHVNYGRLKTTQYSCWMGTSSIRS